MFQEVEVAAWTNQQTGYPYEVRRGVPVDIPDAIAERLLEQTDNWARDDPPARGRGKTEETPAEE
jgi:hypothetical protein